MSEDLIVALLIAGTVVWGICMGALGIQDLKHDRRLSGRCRLRIRIRRLRARVRRAGRHRRPVTAAEAAVARRSAEETAVRLSEAGGVL